MKKIMLLCAVVLGGLFTISCEGPRGPQGGNEYPYVAEYSLSFDRNLNVDIASQVVKNPFELHIGDVALIFIEDGKTNNGNPVWVPLPARYFVGDEASGRTEELEYFYNFSANDFEIIARGSTMLDFFANARGEKGPINHLRNRIFRVVFVPGLDPVNRNATQATSTDATPLSYDEAVVKYNLQKVEVHKKY